MKTVIFLLLIFTACLVRSDNKGSDAMYVKLTKGLVLNYGEPSLARLRYLKVDVHARVKSADDADAVEYHSPALQDILVSIFCAQDEDSVASAEGKEEFVPRYYLHSRSSLKRKKVRPSSRMSSSRHSLCSDNPVFRKAGDLRQEQTKILVKCLFMLRKLCESFSQGVGSAKSIRDIFQGSINELLLPIVFKRTN